MTPPTPPPREDAPISQAEMIEMFGEAMPIEAISLMLNAAPEKTLAQLRAELRALADTRKAPREDVEVLQDHRDAAGELWRDLGFPDPEPHDGQAAAMLETMAHAFAARHRTLCAPPAGDRSREAVAPCDIASKIIAEADRHYREDEGYGHGHYHRDILTIPLALASPQTERADGYRSTTTVVDGRLSDALEALPVRTLIVNVDTGERGQQSVELPLDLRDAIIAALATTAGE